MPRNVARLSVSGLTALSVLALSACGGSGGGGETTAEGGEDFPTDTIEMIIPYAAGGSTDVSVRLMASIAEDVCDAQVIASNQTGSAGAVGFTATANAEPDGYTVGATASELAILHQLGTTEVTPEDVAGVMRYLLNPHVVFVPEDSPYQTMEDIIAAAESGTTINLATPGTGSAGHLSAEGVALEAGVPGAFTNVPFDGDATALQAIVGGQADMVMMVLGTALPQVEAGRVRPIAVAAEERLEGLPDVPTLAESGIEWSSGTHLGLAVPVGTPEERIEILDDCFRQVIETDDFKQRMDELNFQIDYLPPAEFEQYLSDLEESYGQVIDEVGLA